MSGNKESEEEPAAALLMVTLQPLLSLEEAVLEINESFPSISVLLIDSMILCNAKMQGINRCGLKQ